MVGLEAGQAESLQAEYRDCMISGYKCVNSFRVISVTYIMSIYETSSSNFYLTSPMTISAPFYVCQ